MKFWQIIILVLGILFHLPFTNYAIPAKEEIIADLSEKWLFYDDDKEAFLPFIVDMETSKGLPIHLILDLKERNGTFIYFEVQAGGYLLLNNLLVEKFSKDGWHELRLDELKSYGEQVLVTLYTPKKRQKQILAWWTNAKQKVESLDLYENTNILSYKNKQILRFRDFLVSISVFILGIIAFAANWSESLYDSKVWLDKISDFLRPIRFSVKHSSIETLTFVFLASLILGHSIVLFEEYCSLLNPENRIINSQNFFDYLFHFLFTCVKILFVFVAKYLIVWFCTNLQFNNRQIILIHFQIFVRYGKIFMAVNFALLSTLSLIAYKIDVFWVDATFILLIFGLVIHSFIISFFVFRTINLKKLYLFSYLCATEFIPLFLIIKMFL